MLKGQLVKCENIICGKLVECKIVNPKIENEFTTDIYVEVEIMEGQFKGQYAMVRVENIIAEKVNASAKLSFRKHEDRNDYFDTIEDRAIFADVDVKASTIEEADLVLDNLIDKLQGKYGYEFFRCGGQDDNLCTMYDTFVIEFEYGKMSQLKKEAREIFKDVKKELGIR